MMAHEEWGPVIRHRSRALAVISAVKNQLAPVEAELDRVRPPHIKRMVQPIQAALMVALGSASGSPDPVSLGVDIVCGFACVRDIPASGWWTERESPATLDFDSLDHASWNDRLEMSTSERARAASASARSEASEVYRKTLQEKDKGLVHGPFSIGRLDEVFGRGKWRAMQRFGVKQRDKIRPCDNARGSLHNKGTSRHEKMDCETPDFPARAAAELRAAAGEARLEIQSGTDDLADAYRHVPCATPQFTVFAVWSPDLQRTVFFTMPGFNFGLSAAVPQFNRLPEETTLVCRMLLGTIACHFFDDFNLTEPKAVAASGQRALRELHRLIGMPFSEAKAVDVNDWVLFLGVVSDFARFDECGKVRMYVSPERQAKISLMVREALASRQLHAAAAARLAGKLGFTLAWAFGRFGRAAMQPLHRRAAGTETSEYEDGDLSPGLRSSLEFFRETIPLLRPLDYDADVASEPPTLVWSDGRYDMESPYGAPEPTGRRPRLEQTGVGYVIAIPLEGASMASSILRRAVARGERMREARRRLTSSYRFVHGSAEVSEDFMRGFRARKQYIGQVELLGALAPYLSVPDLLRGKRVIHWIDNSSALAALVKGYSGVPDSVRIVHAFHAFVSGMGSRLWMEYVPSAANVSDAPSRDDLDDIFYDFGFGRRARGLGSESVGLILPRMVRWDDEAARWWSWGERA